MKLRKSRPESSQGAQSKASLQRFGDPLHQNHYIAGYQLPNGRQLAVERCAEGFYLWSESCHDKVPDAFRSAHRRHYGVDRPRNADLNGKTAPRLKKDRPADYWCFDTLGDLERFAGWYASF